MDTKLEDTPDTLLTVSERISKLRRCLIRNSLNGKRYTIKEIAHVLGVTRGVIENIEYNRNKNDVKDYIINNICKTFNVREEWLRTGKEPIFSEIEEEPLIDIVAKKFNLSDTAKAVVDTYLNLTDEEQQLLEKFILKTVSNSNIAKAKLAEMPEQEKTEKK